MIPAVIDSTSVVLASGGAKGITAQCVTRLAEVTGCRFILLGRSALPEGEPAWSEGVQDPAELKRRIMEDQKGKGQSPTPQSLQRAFNALISQREILATLEAVERAGGEAIYVSADVTDEPALREKLAEAERRFGPVSGILHGAGSLADKFIENKTLQDFESVFAPKVTGLQKLLACIPPEQLRFLVLFSSVAGFYGNTGQADYALANEILNKAAYRLRRQVPGCRVVSINWGPWEGGMVTAELKKVFEAQGIRLIPAAAGSQILADVLLRPDPVPVQVLAGSALARPTVPPGEVGRTVHVERSLRIADNPFLLDHRIGDRPVLPATCAAAWIAHTCEQIYPGFHFAQMDDYRVLKGIVFEGDASQSFTLDLKLVESTGNRVVLDAVVWSQVPNGRPRFHYKANVSLADVLPDPKPDPAFSVSDMDTSAAMPGQRFYEDGTLFHGPSFQGVQRVLHVSEEGIRMENFLPPLDEAIQGQFPVRSLNPFLNDAVVQSLLIWSMRHYQSPCLPASLERLEQYRPLSFGVVYHVDLKIRSHCETSVVGDLLVQDAERKPYLRFIGLEGTISKHLARFFGKEQPSARQAALVGQQNR